VKVEELDSVVVHVFVGVESGERCPHTY
jgi:hypothetical protein